jgi:hypothetical protein
MPGQFSMETPGQISTEIDMLSAAGDVMLLMAAYAVIAAIASSLRDRAMVEA